MNDFGRNKCSLGRFTTYRLCVLKFVAVPRFLPQLLNCFDTKLKLCSSRISPIISESVSSSEKPYRYTCTYKRGVVVVTLMWLEQPKSYTLPGLIQLGFVVSLH